jgi:hypothetical protein
MDFFLGSSDPFAQLALCEWPKESMAEASSALSHDCWQSRNRTRASEKWRVLAKIGNCDKPAV